MPVIYRDYRMLSAEIHDHLYDHLCEVYDFINNDMEYEEGDIWLHLGNLIAGRYEIEYEEARKVMEDGWDIWIDLTTAAAMRRYFHKQLG